MHAHCPPGFANALSSTPSSLREVPRKTISLLSHLSGRPWTGSGTGARPAACPGSSYEQNLGVQTSLSPPAQNIQTEGPPAATVTPCSQPLDIMERLGTDRCVGEGAAPLPLRTLSCSLCCLGHRAEGSWSGETSTDVRGEEAGAAQRGASQPCGGNDSEHGPDSGRPGSGKHSTHTPETGAVCFRGPWTAGDLTGLGGSVQRGSHSLSTSQERSTG